MDDIMKQNVQILTEMSNEKFNKDYYRLEFVKAQAELASKTAQIVDLEQKILDNKLEAIKTLEKRNQKINDFKLIIDDMSNENRRLTRTIKKLEGLKIK
tara:strand:- start:6533 stop:6829 length:297 start_codon:yes stop_codon:yes gene_type:complete